MSRRTLASIGAGAALTVTATGLAVGLSGPAPLTGPAAAAELSRFDSCEQLRRWYVDAALPHVGPWGLGGGVPAVAENAAGLSGSEPLPVGETPVLEARGEAAGPADAVGSNPTGTNVQEAGVDEPDVAKTDGTVVAHVHDRAVVLTDVAGSRPRELSRLPLPAGLHEAELLLVDGRLVVLGRSHRYRTLPEPLADDRVLPPPPSWRPATTVVLVDVSDPGAPRTLDRTVYHGDLLSARGYDDDVRLVLSTGAPDLDFVTPGPSRSARQALEENRRILRQSRVEDWLPTVTGANGTVPLVECGGVHHPEQASGWSTLSVVAFPAVAPDERETTAVTAAGDLVYSSADRLYVGTSAVDAWAGPVLRSTPPDELGDPDGDVDGGVDSRDQWERGQVRTSVHAFALDGRRTEYVASGTVPGRIRDRWSFSEHDGHLRVATTLGENPWEADENAVVVLAEQGGDLVETGRVAGMGIREQIQSVRWFGDLAVLVTFRQLDPLYTVDLSDPERPRVMGELKIPGFSAYLHPLGDDRLLGLGQDANRSGRTRGAQASLFDLADLATPARVATETFGPDTTFLAAFDTRAFTYLPDRRTALAPLQDQRTGAVRLVALLIGDDGSITTAHDAVVGGWRTGTVRTLPLGEDRVAVVAGSSVRLLGL